METRKILFGFNDEKFENSIRDLLRKIDVETESFARTSKAAVRDTLKKNPDMDAVVLTESVEGSGLRKREKYTAEELASLADESNANVIVVLSENHVGTDYVRVLLDAGITCALFVGAKKAVTAKEVATLIVRKRTKREARELYGVGGGRVDLGFIERDQFNELYSRYKTREGSPIENFLYICGNLQGPKEVADFTKRLPKDEIDYLSSFEEFHGVMDALKKLGYDLKVPRPKKTSVGMKNPPQIGVSGGTMVIEARPGTLGTKGEGSEEGKKPGKGGGREGKGKKGFSFFGRKKEDVSQAAGENVTGVGEEDETPSVAEEVREELEEVREEIKETSASGALEAPTSEGKGDYGEFGDMSIDDMLAMMGAESMPDPEKAGRDSETVAAAQAAERERFVLEAAEKAKAEEERRRAEEERKALEEEELRRAKAAEAAERAAFEEKARRKAEEESRRAEENARRAAENARRAEERKKADEARKAEKAKKEEEKRLAREEAKKEAKRKREEREAREERDMRKADEMKRRLDRMEDDGLSAEFPIFDDEIEDVALGGPRKGKSGLYLIAVIILLALLGGLWYLEGGGGFEIPGF